MVARYYILYEYLLSSSFAMSRMIPPNMVTTPVIPKSRFFIVSFLLQLRIT